MTGGNRMESFSKTCREYGMEPGARLLDRKIVPVREDEKAFWGCEEETLLLYIQRVRTADGQPIFLENLFLLYEDFKPLMQANWYNTSAFAAIEEVGGRRVTDTSRRTIEIARASSEQASALNVPLGEPLLFLNCYFIAPRPYPIIAPIPITLPAICSLSIPAIREVKFCKQFCKASAKGRIIIAHIRLTAQPPPRR